MKKLFFAGLLIIVLMLPAPLGAEIYKYIDENGQKRWTDDLSQIPVEQRPAAQQIESVSDATQEKAVEQEQSGIEVTAPDESGATDGLSREALETEKGNLDSQYQQLLGERKILEEMKAKGLDAAARADLNDRISVFNTKTEQYEKQLEAFNEKVNAYNQKINAN